MRSTLSIPVPGPLSGAVVRLVGPAGPPPVVEGLKPVVGFDYRSLFGDFQSGEDADPERIEPAIPPDALWPDGENVVLLLRPSSQGGLAASGLRNPWEIRRVRKASLSDLPIDCGGIIVGGHGGPAAIVNGRIVRRGDRVESFNVAAIRRAEVLLEENGVVVVLPRGRTVMIRMPHP